MTTECKVTAVVPTRKMNDVEDPRVGELFKMILPAAGGSFIEWYDFAIYGYVSSYITANFFADGRGGSVATWAGFGLTFVVRPLGGAFFGWIADNLGRKPAMQASIVLMLIATVLQGLLPTFYCCSETSGWIGLAGLLCCRVIQGLSAGGEMSCAAAYIAEISPRESLGFNLSWISVTGNFGSYLVASLVIMIFQTVFDKEFMHMWGWRLMFLSSIIPGLTVLVARRYLKETPDFEELLKTQAEKKATLQLEGGACTNVAESTGTWQELLAHHKLALLIGSLGTACIGAIWYVVPIYGMQFVGQYNSLSPNEVSLSYTICYTVSLLLVPLVGKLIDVWGVGKVFVLTAFTGTVLAPIPLFYWWTHVSPWFAVSSVYIGMAIIGLQGALTCSVYLWVVELFPVNVRTTGVSVAYNIGVGIFGGMGPLVSDAANEVISPQQFISAPVAFTLLSGIVSMSAVVASRVLANRGMMRLTHLRESPY